MTDLSIPSRALHKITPFSRFLGAAGLANLGDGIATVLWAWMASLLTRDPVLIALLPIAMRLPWFLFSIPAGLLADRMDRLRLILMCDATRSIAYGLAAFAVWHAWPIGDAPKTGITHVWLYVQLTCLALFVGSAEVLRDTAAPSLLPRLVPDEGLEQANGKIYALETVGTSLAGPAVGAFLIALFLPVPFVTIALLFATSALLMKTLAPQLSAPRTASTSSLGDDLKQAFAFVINHHGIRLLILVSGAWCFFVEMGTIALVLHMQDNLGASSQAYGITLAAGALGGVLGGFVATPLLARFSVGRMLRFNNLFDGAVFTVIAIAPNTWVIAAALFVFHFTGVMWMTLVVSYRQREIPTELFGRVSAISRLFAFGLIPLGMLASGILVRLCSEILPHEAAITVPFYVAGAGLTIQVLLSWRAIGRIFPG